MWGYEDELPCLKLDLPSECGGNYGSSSEDEYDWGDDDDDSWGSDDEEEEDSSDSGLILFYKIDWFTFINCSPKMFGLQGS